MLQVRKITIETHRITFLHTLTLLQYRHSLATGTVFKMLKHISINFGRWNMHCLSSRCTLQWVPQYTKCQHAIRQPRRPWADLKQWCGSYATACIDMLSLLADYVYLLEMSVIQIERKFISTAFRYVIISCASFTSRRPHSRWRIAYFRGYKIVIG